MQGSKKHSLIIGRETLMLPLPILIIFGFHPVSGDGFVILPLCREWIKKSYPHRQDFLIHSLGRRLSTHPCPMDTQLVIQFWWGNKKGKLEALKISHGLRLLLGLGKSLGRWGWISHSLIISREVLILTLTILTALRGCISWYIHTYGLMMRECLYAALSRDVLGCTSQYIPPPLGIVFGYIPTLSSAHCIEVRCNVVYWRPLSISSSAVQCIA